MATRRKRVLVMQSNRRVLLSAVLALGVMILGACSDPGSGVADGGEGYASTGASSAGPGGGRPGATGAEGTGGTQGDPRDPPDQDPADPGDGGAATGATTGAGHDDGGTPDEPWIPPPLPVRDAPDCSGFPLACSSRSIAGCRDGLGCYIEGDCEGSSESCFSQFSSFACYDQDGCYWSDNSGTSNDYCAGSSRSCGSYSSRFSCVDQDGCDWDESCLGTALSCDGLSPGTCVSQPGCGRTCALGRSLCGDECVDTDTDYDHCGSCGFECGPRSRCVEGGCECGAPYTLCDGRCVDTDEDNAHCGSCGNYCGSGTTCTNGDCADIDECDFSPCHGGRECTNSDGGFSCGECPSGYRTNGSTDCADIDECVSNHGGCSANATCTNYAGSSSCTCRSGFTGSGKTCNDVDECATNRGGCDALRACLNSIGGYACGACPSGYDDVDGLDCVDVDECAADNGGCDPRVECTNTNGSRVCGSCPLGFAGTGDTACTDIDECAVNRGGCSPLRECLNLPGSHSCGECDAGYEEVGARECRDIDECGTGIDACDRSLRDCVNAAGSYTCEDCPRGYTNQGLFACTDVDECQTNNGGCDVLTACVNNEGSRTCSACPGGFSGDGYAGCKDIDECEANNGQCDALTECTNTVGSRLCSACPAGHLGTGDTACVPALLSVETSDRASIEPGFSPHGLSYDLEWAPSAGAKSMRWTVAPGVMLRVNGVAQSSGAWVPISVSAATSQITVELTAANGEIALYTFSTRSGCAPRYRGKLVGETSNTNLGASVAVARDFAVLGTRTFGSASSQHFGQVVLFNGTEPTMSTRITPSSSVGGGWGVTVAVAGDRALAGFPGARVNDNPNTGIIEVGTRSGDTWTSQARLDSPFAAFRSQTRFGDTLATHGDLLAVAHGRGDHVSIGRWSAGSYRIETNLGFPDPVGISAALAWAGDRLLIGAGGHAARTEVSVATLVNGTWTLTGSIPALDTSRFGASLAFHEASGTLFVGSPDADGDASTIDSGRVYVYTLEGDAFTYAASLDPALPVASGNFGSMLAVTDEWLAIESSGDLDLYWLGDHTRTSCGTLSPTGDGTGYAQAVGGFSKSLVVGVAKPGFDDRSGAAHFYRVADWNLGL